MSELSKTLRPEHLKPQFISEVHGLDLPAKGGLAQSRRVEAKRIGLFRGIVLLGVLAIAAWKQPLRTKGDYPTSTLTGALNWFSFPYEVNPWYRPLVPTPPLWAIVMVPVRNDTAVVEHELR